MKRKTGHTHQINLDLLHDLILKAIGDNKIRDFSVRSGLGTTILSHMVNGHFDSKPMPLTLIKIARASDGRVSSAELLDAAGFDPYTVLPDGPDSQNITKEQYTQNCILTINDHWGKADKSRTWSILNYGKGHLYDLSGLLKKKSSANPMECMIYCKILFEESVFRQVFRKKLCILYGDIAVEPFDENDLFMIFTNNSKLFETAKTIYSPVSLNVRTQIVLTDPTGSSIIDQSFIGKTNMDSKWKAFYKK